MEKFSILLRLVGQNRIIAALLGIAFFFIVADLIIIAANIGGLSSPVILHFDSFRGVDRFGEKADLWAILFGVLIFTSLNCFLSHSLFYKERFLAYLLLGVNVLIGLFSFIVLANLISIN